MELQRATDCCPMTAAMSACLFIYLSVRLSVRMSVCLCSNRCVLSSSGHPRWFVDRTTVASGQKYCYILWCEHFSEDVDQKAVWWRCRSGLGGCLGEDRRPRLPSELPWLRRMSSLPYNNCIPHRNINLLSNSSFFSAVQPIDCSYKKSLPVCGSGRPAAASLTYAFAVSPNPECCDFQPRSPTTTLRPSQRRQTPSSVLPDRRVVFPALIRPSRSPVLHPISSAQLR